MTAAPDNRRRLARLLGSRPLTDLRDATVVVLPSVTTSPTELQRTRGATFLEERLLFTVLLLRHPAVELIYVTSLPVDPAVVAYHLRLLPDPEAARTRLTMVALDDPTAVALTHKLLDRPDTLDRLRTAIDAPDRAYLLCYKVTRAEHAVAAALGIPLDGPALRHMQLDSKTAARRIAGRAGVAVVDGEDGLSSVGEVEQALERLRRRGAGGAMIKLNEGFAGRGNAIVALDRSPTPLTAARVELVADDETWPAFAAKLECAGGVVEELLDGPEMASCCAQMRIAPTGDVQVVSVYDMTFAGSRRQIYSGCRFPSPASHRDVVTTAATRLAGILARDGVHGWFGLDFLVDRSVCPALAYLSEINLRMGGGTHPFWLAALASGGTYTPTNGDLRVDGHPTSYVGTDDIAFPGLAGATPRDIIELVDGCGLAFDPSCGRGVMLQFLGAVPELGMMGATCIADTPQDADELLATLRESVRRFQHERLVR